ncbi:MAG: redoxin domain-containing protein [Persicimonas sp.]
MKPRNLLVLALAALLTMTIGCEKPAEEGDQAEAVEAEGGQDEAAEAEGEEESEEEGAAQAADEKSADEEKEPAKATVGEPAPDFELVDEAGESHKLSDYEGKTVVLEWFNPGCPYVVRHHEEDKTMSSSREAVGEDVVWLAVDSTRADEKKDSKEYKEKWEIDYPVLQDADGEVGKLYTAKTTPHMYVIDKDGTLRYSGAIDDDPRGKKEIDERTNHLTEAVNAVQEDEEVAQKETKPYGCSVKYDS